MERDMPHFKGPHILRRLTYILDIFLPQLATSSVCGAGLLCKKHKWGCAKMASTLFLQTQALAGKMGLQMEVEAEVLNSFAHCRVCKYNSLVQTILV